MLIVVDTLRADRLGCYGYPRATSPVIDQLASEGVLFEDASAQASWTLVSMSSLWTGRYVTDNLESPAPEWPVMAEVFHAAGYRTIGASANPLLCEEDGFGRGFDDYRCYRTHGREAGCDQLVADLWAPIDQALAAGAKGERQPVFLYLQPLDPHTPYRRHREFDGALPPDGTRPLQPEGWHAKEAAELGAPAPADDPGWRRAFAEMHTLRGFYDQEIRFVDEQIGELMKGLRERGLLDHALVVLAADHGEGLWDHFSPLAPEKQREMAPKDLFLVGHGYTLFQEAVHTPLVLWGAGVPKGVRVAQPVENLDVFPTLLDLAGLDPSLRLDGRSLIDLVRGRADRWRTLTYSFVRQNVGVYDRASGHKLVEPTDFGLRKGLAVGLYHLPSDPLERVNLAEREPAEVARLRAELDAWRNRNPLPDAGPRSQSAETLESLMALGYTGDLTPALDGVKQSGGESANETGAEHEETPHDE